MFNMIVNPVSRKPVKNKEETTVCAIKDLSGNTV